MLAPIVALTLLGAANRAPGPESPGVCEVVGHVAPRGDRVVAKLRVTLRVRTTRPRTVVRLGTGGAFVLAARLPSGGLPPLRIGPAGLTYLAETPGEHAVILEVEARVGPRGPGGEPGFEFGLPRAAITTLKLTWATPPGRVTVAPRVGGVASGTGEEPEALAAAGGYPLGPAESVEVTWAGANRAAPPAAEVDVSVRAEEAAVETVAKFRLRGAAAEWRFLFAAGADVVAERASRRPTDGEATPELVRPTDKLNPVWTFRPPEVGGDWLVTATDRRPWASPRPNIKLGPAAVLGVTRQTGSVRLSSPPALRLAVAKSAAELRRLDPVPTDADNDAAFRYTLTGSTPGPFLELSAKSLPGFVRAQPRFSLRRTEAGWQLTADVRITPVRMSVEEVAVDVPAGYRGVEARGAAVESVGGAGSSAARRLAVRLAGPQSAAFDLTLSATYPSPPTARDETVPLLRFPNCQEEPGRVLVSVLEGLEVAGSVGVAEGPAVPLAPEARGPGPVQSVAVTPEKPARRVDASWQPYRPDLAAELRADVSLTERQAVVTQRVRVRPGAGDARAVKLRGPGVGVRALPGGAALLPAGPGEWVAVPPPDAKPGAEVNIAVLYALPLPAGRAGGESARAPLALLWPEGATRVEATVRVFGGGSSRAATRYEGPWREVPPEPAADRDALPWLTLAGSGATLPLTLELGEADPAALAPAVERVLVEAWLGADESLAVRTRFALSRWSPVGAEVEFAGAAPPEVLVGGRRVDAALLTPSPTGAGRRSVRVLLPETRPGGGVLVVEVREVNPSGRAGAAGAVAIEPARLVGAPPRVPPRWRVGFPGDLVPLDLGGALAPESRWVWSRGGATPASADTPAEAAEWLAGGPASEAATPDGPALSARQAGTGPVRLAFVPRAALVGGASALAAAAGLLLARLSRAALGVALAVTGGLAALGAIWRPQPAAELLAAALPGLVALAALGLASALRRARRARRAYRLPGFTRARPAELALPGSGARLARTVTVRPEPAGLALDADAPGAAR